jgi:hypothetical protein
VTTDHARSWLIVSSLTITGTQMIFLLVAPALQFPLEYPKNLYLLQIVTPVFLGYLGAATHFVFKTPSPAAATNNQFLGMLVVGPLASTLARWSQPLLHLAILIAKARPSEAV